MSIGSGIMAGCPFDLGRAEADGKPEVGRALSLLGACFSTKDRERPMHSPAKNRTKTWSLTGAFVVFLSLSAGCPVAYSGPIMPDFALQDVNTTSSTFGQPVSPRDYLQQVSGWYFGHAT